MANHCHYAICFECKGEYCLLGCNYTCDCGKRVPDLDEIKKASDNVTMAEAFRDCHEWF